MDDRVNYLVRMGIGSKMGFCVYCVTFLFFFFVSIFRRIFDSGFEQFLRFSFLEVNFSLFSIDLGKIADFRGTLDFPQCTIDESMNFCFEKVIQTNRRWILCFCFQPIFFFHARYQGLEGIVEM